MRRTYSDNVKELSKGECLFCKSKLHYSESIVGSWDADSIIFNVTCNYCNAQHYSFFTICEDDADLMYDYEKEKYRMIDMYKDTFKFNNGKIYVKGTREDIGDFEIVLECFNSEAELDEEGD